MSDVVSIRDGRVAQKWERTTLAAVRAKLARLGPEQPAASLLEVPPGSVSCGMLYDGASFAPPPPPVPTADDVRSEAARRMQALVGARDAVHLDIVISNANREAIRLLRKGTANWTDAEAARAAQLEAADQMIEAIRAASNVLEMADPIPADFTDDRYWPA